MKPMHDEIEGLSKLGMLSIGDGTKADSRTKKQIEEFYSKYPSLLWDKELAYFYNTYLALNLYNEGESVIATIYGFDTNVTLSVLVPDEPLTSDDGFLRFSESLIYLPGDTAGFNYAYDITGTRPQYVYFRYSVSGPREMKYRPFANNFLEWLIEFRNRKGLTLNSLFDIY